MSIALLVEGDIARPNNWFNPIYQALSSLDHSIRILHPRLVKDWELKNHEYIVSVGWKPVLDNHPKVLVLDLGYFDRWHKVDNPGGTMQLGINKLNWLAPDDVDNRRPVCKCIATRVVPTKPVLVCGQKPGDAQHGLSSRELNEWVTEVIKGLSEKYPERSIWYREHPTVKRAKPPAGVTRMINDGPLEDYLGMVSGLVTYNSTSALYALQRGLPVSCDPVAMYTHMCTSTKQLDTNRLTLVPPAKEEVLRFFERLGYGQWSMTELANPELWKQYLHIIDTFETPEQWQKAPEEEPKVTRQEFELVCQVSSTKNFPKARKIAKQLWRDIIFNNRKDLDAHCNDIIKRYKLQKAEYAGEV